MEINPDCQLGELLRDWRARRGKSQLDTALDADMSQRHLSFIESGRSVPGRDKLLAVAEALDVPLRERNTLLLAAGYAPLYPEQAWDAPQMSAITAAVERMLKQQEPYPAVLLDGHWNVLAANNAAPRFLAALWTSLCGHCRAISCNWPSIRLVCDRSSMIGIKSPAHCSNVSVGRRSGACWTVPASNCLTRFSLIQVHRPRRRSDPMAPNHQ
jgi:transcriptional regulator with XRE-family HTH domain